MPGAAYALLADLTLLGHALFVLFVACGGLLVWQWPRLAWLHVPAVLWGAGVELGGAVCPLTPLENHLRRLAGEVGYAGDFLGHYLEAFIYPAGLTRADQILLGALALLLNGTLYALLLRRRHRRAPQ